MLIRSFRKSWYLCARPFTSVPSAVCVVIGGTRVVSFLMQLLLGIMLLHIWMIFHHSMSLKTYFIFDSSKEKSIFGTHDPLGFRYLFQLRQDLSSLRYHKNRQNFIDTHSDVFVIRVLKILITSYFCVLFCYSKSNLSDQYNSYFTKIQSDWFRKPITPVPIWGPHH